MTPTEFSKNPKIENRLVPPLSLVTEATKESVRMLRKSGLAGVGCKFYFESLSIGNDCVKLKSFGLDYLLYKMLYCFRYLPREVDPLVYNMSHEDPGDVKYSSIGGLGEQIRELREVCL